MVPSLRRLIATVGAVTFVPAWMAAQQPAVISGQVTGEGGRPIPAATVSLAQLGLGATTREDGRYTILVPAARVTGQAATLTARAINFKPQTATITLSEGRTTQDFTLAPNPLQLGEVVVTGAGTTIEAEKFGSVRNYVDAAQIAKANEPNVVQALAAKAPNVVVTQSSGDPGASSYITIRGSRTVGSPNSGAAQPLFVVDGTPLDNSSFSTTDLNPVDGLTSGSIDGTAQTNRLADLNPNDIESVEILKGAAAAAIYGSRAAQGVVLITTKHGKGGATRYSLRTNLSVDDIRRKYPLQTSYGQGLGSVGPTDPTDPTDVCTPSNFACRTSWGPALGPGDAVFDHASEAYQSGVSTDNALTVSGGNERTTFFLSGGYTYNRGIYVGPNNNFQRVTVRVNGSHLITDKLKVGGNMSYADTRGAFIQRGNNTTGLQLGLLRTPPNFNNLPYLNADGLHRTFRRPAPTFPSENRGWDNPFFVLYENEATSQVGRVFGNLNGEWSAANWLKLAYTLGADYANDERLEANALQSSIPAEGGRLTTGKLINYQIDHNLTATANYKVSEGLAGTFTIGQNLNSRNFRQFGNVGRILIAPTPFNLGNTVTRDLPYDQRTTIHTESYFAQGTLDIGQQLFLTAAIRNDGSSTFDSTSRRSWFPKASVAWNFMRDGGGAVSYGKLRVSYGEAGQQPTPYFTSNIYNASTSLGGITQGTGVLPSQGGFGGLTSALQKGADQLKPERTKELEAGFDLGLFNDAADLSFTFYNARTSGVILVTPLAPSTGYFQQGQNVAKFRNRGVEATLNLRPITRKDFAWDVGLQWALNRSKVLDLGGIEYVPLDPNSITPSQVVILDKEVGVWRDLGLVRCGLSPNGPSAAVDGVDLADFCGGQPVGAYYLDENGLPLVDPQQRVIGNPNPRWTGSVRTGIRLGKVQLSGLLDIRHGGQIWNGTRAALYSYGTHKDTEVRADCSGAVCVGNERVIGAADSPLPGPVVGPGVGIPVPIGENWYTDVGGLFGGASEPFMENGGFVKLREISIGYSFDSPWVQRSLGFSSVDVRLSGRNLKTWTDYRGYDPETNLGGAIQATRGMDYFNMPQTRSFALTLTLNR